MRNTSGQIPRKSAKQAIIDISIRWMRAHDQSTVLERKRLFKTQVFAIELIAIEMGWRNIALKLERWREHGNSMSESLSTEGEN